MKDHNSIAAKIFLICIFLFLSTNFLSASSKQSPLSFDEQNVLKNLKISPAKFWLKANNFTAKNSDGLIVSLSDYLGRFILLNFWATWCYPCLKEMPDLEEAFKHFRETQFVVLAVAMGEDVDKIKQFSKKNSFTFPLISDETMEITNLYGVKNIPVTFLIDPEGVVLGRALGIRKWSSPELLKFIKSKIK